MRVLMVVNPQKAIFRYLVTVASALRTAGHEVHVASQPSFAAEITSAGLSAVPLGREVGEWWVDRDFANSWEQERKGIPAPYDAFDHPELATWEYLAPGMADLVRDSLRTENFPLIAATVDYARHWQPDLILWDALSYAGPIAAAATGTAHARILFGIDIFGGVRQTFNRLRDAQPPEHRTDPLADWLGSYARKYGADYTEHMAVGHATIDQFPLSLQTEAPGLTYHRIQYIPYGGPSVIPTWLHHPPTKPRVALTLGLSATDVYNGYNVDINEIIEATCTLDIELVATIAEKEQHRLRTTPPNARIVPYVPWHALAPTCRAVIHHAGAATLATTARHPVPHLALHYHFDQPILAAKLAAHGAGLALPTTEATGDTVRDHVHRLLTEDTFTHRATDLRNEITTLPTPNQLIPTLEELAITHTTH